MAGEKYVIALDQGTTSSRAVLVDCRGRMVDAVQRPFQQIFPRPGWVEHNPQEILFSQIGCLTELITRHGLTARDITAIGIDNQRETTIVWDPVTGAPVTNAIVWQCRRTAEMVELIQHYKVNNIVCTQPFGCLPNHICGKGVMRIIKEKNPQANIVAVDYDSSASKVNQQNRIKLMLANARLMNAQQQTGGSDDDLPQLQLEVRPQNQDREKTAEPVFVASCADQCQDSQYAF